MGLLALLVVWLSVPRTALADPPATPDAAADAKSRADDALVSGRPSEALALYQKAYAIRRDPALVYNMGRAHQALGDHVAALEQLEQFAASAPPDIKARVPGLDKLLAEVRKNVVTVSIVADVAGATVRIQDRIIGKTPLPGPVRVKPGPTVLIVEKEGHFAYERAVVLQGGALSTFDVKLASKQTTAILTVRSAVVGAEVSVDGKREGMVPTEVVIAAGTHEVELTHSGYRKARSSLVIAAGERRTLDVLLEGDAPITKKWWFWTGLAAVAIGTTVTIIALTTERDPGAGSVAPGRISAGLSF